ncbi:hypothetical protein [Dactylosporangium darangshiense]|uniref:hypothetical protein n=1 Tax=Dactylosporangium darangshiense TaxID=579108 RepID=UPI0031E515DD
MTLEDPQTPYLALDPANVERLRARLDRLGVALRPHVKTAKSLDVARLVQDEPGPVTVSMRPGSARPLPDIPVGARLRVLPNVRDRGTARSLPRRGRRRLGADPGLVSRPGPAPGR